MNKADILALKNTIKMWDTIAKEHLTKIEYFGRDVQKYILNDCFLCERANKVSKRKNGNYCNVCLLKTLWSKDINEEFYCENSDSLYYKWCTSLGSKRDEYARDIADLAKTRLYGLLKGAFKKNQKECDVCHNMGYLISIADASDTYVENALHIERCDACKKYVNDIAAEKAAAKDGIVFYDYLKPRKITATVTFTWRATVNTTDGMSNSDI